ncbi:retinal guanylyl cyclase 2 [Platysternon megacephalum]|uniref:Retinal guanylyl cyclase 2 n=1 Tax=Platysternon megacephalum TaxID=55544 RepID=A0A4D9DK23_9SAUR|nr:retinal guanylyl cyclase 2 [Platysternon megacephalum]
MGLRLLLGLLWALGGCGSGLPGPRHESGPHGAGWGARRAGGSSRRQREDLGHYWHVTPRILQGNRTLSMAETDLEGFPARLQVALDLEGAQLVLELEQNREVAPGARALLYYLPNGTRVTQAAGSQGNCCYQGHVREYPGSWASICTCSGLSGVLVASENRSYGLEPDPQGPRGRHLAYRPRDVRLGQRECGLGPPNHTQPLLDPEPRRGKREAAPEQPFVELVMVVDHAEFQNYPNMERIQTRMLEIANQVDTDHSVSVLVVASTVAHQLGHNLGMTHDGAGRGCDCLSPYQERSCIMAPPTGLMPGLSFSSCSRQDVERSLRRGQGWCLFNVPEPESLVVRPRCGNWLVEKDETCDCGLREQCTDPCCNASTCRLAPGAECATGDTCCHDCKLRGAGSVCREPRGECDLPEFCDGLSPRCPPNTYLQDGQPCAGGQAYCYGGACTTYQGQCQELWGPGSGPVSDVCMASLNARGDEHGHCGQRPNGTYIPCAQRDAGCGRLQCQGGSARGTLEDGVAPGCRGTPLPLGEDVSDLAMVLPGTACGPGKVCSSGHCRDVSELGVQECGSQCHGHGVCNNNGHCHCEAGWAAPACNSLGAGGSVDSGPGGLEQGGSVLPTALLILATLILALALGLCYAKRTGLHQHLCQLGKGTSCQYSTKPGPQVQLLSAGVSADPNGISQLEPRDSNEPHPGHPRPLPAELQMMPISKPIPHGWARPDPPSKPLPPDPVPKESQPPGPAKLPLPRRLLPSDPTGPLVSGPELSYGPHVMVLPSRPAPPPPTGHLQYT